MISTIERQLKMLVDAEDYSIRQHEGFLIGHSFKWNIQVVETTTTSSVEKMEQELRELNAHQKLSAHQIFNSPVVEVSFDVKLLGQQVLPDMYIQCAQDPQKYVELRYHARSGDYSVASVWFLKQPVGIMISNQMTTFFYPTNEVMYPKMVNYLFSLRDNDEFIFDPDEQSFGMVGDVFLDEILEVN